MAKKSMIMRELKRTKLVKRYAKKRAELKAIIRNLNSSDEDRLAAQQKLNALPRDSSPSRQRSRCAITGYRVTLRPGRYLATIERNGKTRDTEFSVISGGAWSIDIGAPD